MEREPLEKIWHLEALNKIGEKYDRLQSRIEKWMSGSENIEIKLESFEEEVGLERVHELAFTTLPPESAEAQTRLMTALSSYYTAGFFLESLGGQVQSSWWLTRFFMKGNNFALDVSDQVKIPLKLPRMSPLQVKSIATPQLLKAMNMPVLPLPSSAQSFLFKPSHQSGLLLMSETPEPWLKLKVEHTMNLLNRFYNP